MNFKKIFSTSDNSDQTLNHLTYTCISSWAGDLRILSISIVQVKKTYFRKLIPLN